MGLVLMKVGRNGHLEAARVIKPWLWGAPPLMIGTARLASLLLLLSAEGAHEQVPAPKATIEGRKPPGELGCPPVENLRVVFGKKGAKPSLPVGQACESMYIPSWLQLGRLQ